MAAIADFSDDLFGGAQLILISLVLGGVVCGLVLLRPFGKDRTLAGAPLQYAIGLIVVGAGTLAPLQLTHLALTALALSETIGHPVYSTFFATPFADAALTRAALAGCIFGAGLWLLRAPASRARWALVAVLGLAMAVAGAWLSHGASRFQDRAALMTLTALHTAAAGVWVGGVALLISLWRLASRDPRYAGMWPVILRRFSVVGMGALAVIVVTAIPLGTDYVANPGGLIGTSYGAMILVKTGLLVLALAFAALNFRAARAVTGQSTPGPSNPIRTETPFLIEAEFIVLAILLLSAASLASQPPAVDISKERATWSEVVSVFAPKMPRLTTPSIDEMPKERPSPVNAVPGRRTVGDEWSEFNHNVSGIFLIVMSVAALLSRVKGFAWCRHWPAGFVALAVFLFVRSDPEAWPSGPIGFFASLQDAEVLQHRLAILLALVLGLLEWRVRAARTPNPRLAYLFPVLVVFGAVLLLTHSHTAFEIKATYLIQVSHTAMGFLAVIVAAGRWLELRLPPPASAAAGLASSGAMLLIGFILLFYAETIV